MSGTACAPTRGGPWVGSPTVSDRDDLLRVIKEKAVVYGDFVLSSGQRASWYIDLRRVLLSGQAAPLAGRVMLAATADLGYDAVGGLTLGGVTQYCPLVATWVILFASLNWLSSYFGSAE